MRWPAHRPAWLLGGVMGSWSSGRVLTVAAVVLTLPDVVGAQPPAGSLSGEIGDAATGAPLGEVRVTASGPALAAPRSVVTDREGRFALEALPPGLYRLEAAAEGFLAEGRDGLEVKPGTTLRVRLALTPDTVALEEVVVTGSHIQRKDLVSAAPLTVITRDQLQASGKLLLADYLQARPEQANAPNAQWNNGGDGSIRVSLRGLGTNRTLVLLNGRRYVAGGLGADDSVDLGSLPSAAVERVEILKDGASPIYGSEAIGGVVNVITRRSFSGTEVSAYAGGSTHGDGSAYAVDITSGVAGDRGSLLLTAGFSSQQPIWSGQRGWSDFAWAYDANGVLSPLHELGPYAVGSPNAPAGRVFVIGEPGQTIPNPDHDPRTDLYNQLVTSNPDAVSFVPDPAAPLGWRAWRGAALPQYGGDQYNYAPANYLVTPSQRLSLFTTAETKLGSRDRAFLELTYVNRQSQQKLAPEPLVLAADGITISASNVYNPFGVDIPDARGRLLGNGNRTFTQNVESLRALVGLDGILPQWAGPLENWRWELTGNFGRTLATQTRQGYARISSLRNALGPSFNYGTQQSPDWGCGTNEHDRITGCVPLDLFGTRGPITAEQTAALVYEGSDRGSNQLVDGLASVSGELFRLWAGRPVGIAAGYEYRKAQGRYVPDPVVASGDAATDGAIFRTDGWQDVHEGYLEISLPFLEGIPIVEVLEAQLAARVFRYSGFGTDWTWKVGARWKPVRDLTLRGTASTAFRAPSIWELSYGTNTTHGFHADPCAGVDENGQPVPISPWCGAAANNGQASPLVTFRNQGNPALQPETARVFTAGVVLEPRFLPGLSIAWDAYGVAIDRVIQFSGLDPVDACYPMQADAAPLYCDQVSRDPTTHAIQGVTESPVNVGSERMLAYDLAVRWGAATSIGRLDFTWDSTWLERYDMVRGDGSVLRVRGNTDYSRGYSWANPTLRFNAAAAWSRGPLRAIVDVRYLSGLKECAGDDGAMGGVYCSFQHSYEHRISDFASWGLQGAYAFTTGAGRTELVLGVQNLLDAQPPRTYGAFYPSDPGYDFTGRFIYARLTHRL